MNKGWSTSKIGVGGGVALAAVLALAGCQSTLLSDNRIALDTAGVLQVAPDYVTISNRRSDGASTTYYTAKTRGGREYACIITGGGIPALGQVNPPSCDPKRGR